jgi:glycosyltransferase involved in cell wall biosynthesis
MKTANLLSVIIPVYNSQSSLVELFEGILHVFNSIKQPFEVIFVDDNSRDRSWEVLTSLKKQYPRFITTIRLSRNCGQHNATLCGFTFAKGDFMITIDDDLQTPPSEIKKLIESRESENCDLVYGVSHRKKHSVIRNAGSRSLKTSARVLHKSPGEGSSFRLISGDLVSKILHHHQNFIFLDEIFYWYTDDIGFVEVEHHPRKYDQSGYSFGKLFRLVANLILYYTMVPLKVLVYGGLIISMITFIYGLFFIFKKLVFDVPLGFTSLIVTILFSTSIILFSLGVLGEYLSRIYQLQNRKPPYSIRKVVEREDE